LLKLVGTTTLPNGVVVLDYRPRGRALQQFGDGGGRLPGLVYGRAVLGGEFACLHAMDLQSIRMKRGTGRA
jgi:hypothetical protein